MKWNEMFTMDRMPSEKEIGAFVGETKPYWDQLVSHVERTYGAKRQMDFSKDVWQPGWNVKYRKGGKALCALYPMNGFFLVLVVVGKNEEGEVKPGMETGLYSPQTKELYEKSAHSLLGRWLMIEVKEPTVLQDIQRLIRARIKPKRLDNE